MIKDGKMIENTMFCGRTDVFEIVDYFPEGYIVWPIGRENFPYKGYIPLCKVLDDGYHVDVSSLKALKIHEGLANYTLIQASKRGVNKSQFDEMCRVMNYEIKKI